MTRSRYTDPTSVRQIGQALAAVMTPEDSGVADLVGEHLAATGDLVWIAVARRGVEYHRLAAAGSTRCRRSTRTGEIRLRVDVTEKHDAKPCRRCWPEPDREG